MLKLFRFLFLSAALLFANHSRAQQDSTMFVHYINVGQAAAVLLEFPCGAMLIDAGAQDSVTHKGLVDYLTHFFEKRQDLNNTLALVMVTHPHIDHDEVLYDIAHKFHIARYIDDGLRIGSGKKNQEWMQDTAAAEGIPYEAASFDSITAGGNKAGKTDSIIDPINCANGDPIITLYSGRFVQKPAAWADSDFTNYNNHSLVVKVLFGKSSFLFTGDLETKGIQSVMDEYAGTGALDVDVLMVGHHGAANATTPAYLGAVTPSYAVISCGKWNYGKGKTNPFTTYFYGHPRISTINMLADSIPGKRAKSRRVEAAVGVKNFKLITVSKQIYATPWDKTIIIQANMNGEYQVSTGN